MRVLYLTNGFPYPLTSGYLRHYHLIRELTARHEITLLSLAGGSFRDEDADALRPMVERVEAFANRRTSPIGRITRHLRALVGGAESPAVTAMSDRAAALHAE